MFVFVLNLFGTGQSADDNVSHCDVNVGSTAGDRGFVLAAEQAITAKPAERAFDDPAMRQHFETTDVCCVRRGGDGGQSA